LYYPPGEVQASIGEAQKDFRGTLGGAERRRRGTRRQPGQHISVATHLARASRPPRATRRRPSCSESKPWIGASRQSARLPPPPGRPPSRASSISICLSTRGCGTLRRPSRFGPRQSRRSSSSMRRPSARIRQVPRSAESKPVLDPDVVCTHVQRLAGASTVADAPGASEHAVAPSGLLRRFAREPVHA
jgi:hypothetical protein